MTVSADLTILKNLWMDKVKAGEKHRDKRFGKDAEEIMRFYKGPHDFIFVGRETSHIFLGDADADMPEPTFKITVNKVAEFVHAYIPVLVNTNPDRIVDPRRPKIAPHILQRAGVNYDDAEEHWARKHIKGALQQSYLNYTPNEFRLKQHIKKALFDSLTAGRGILWAGLVPAVGGGYNVGSFFDGWKSLVTDPDSKSLSRAGWIVRERILPVWEAERMFKHPGGYLKKFASMESVNTQAVLDGSTSMPEDTASRRALGTTSDIIKFYEVYSRVGLGGNLAGATTAFQEALPVFGDYAYLAISDQCDFPLNMPPYLFETGDPFSIVSEAIQWPFPFYKDPTDPWPCSVLDYHELNEESWPLAPFQPVLGEQEWLDWCYSFLAGKIKNISRDLILLPDSLHESVIDKILHGSDLEAIPIDFKHAEMIKDLIRFISHPPVHADLWRMAQIVEEAINVRTGMNDLLRGAYNKQMRTKDEATTKRDFSMIRPDYYSDCVDDFLSLVARKEALVAQQIVTPRQISIMCGELKKGTDQLGQPTEQLGVYGQLWAKFVQPQSFEEAAAEFDYRIESGQARKPNRAALQESIDSTAQFVLPILGDVYKQTGDPTAINAWFAKWAETRDMEEDTVRLPDLRQMMQEQQQQAQQAGAQTQQAAQSTEAQKQQTQAQAGQSLMEQSQQEQAMRQRQGELRMSQEQQMHQQKMMQLQQMHEQMMSNKANQMLLQQQGANRGS